MLLILLEHVFTKSVNKRYDLRGNNWKMR